MQVRVLLFAELAEIMETTSIVLDLQDDLTIADLMQHLARLHQPIARMQSHLAVALDGRYARPSDQVSPGIDVALIPPISGG